MNLGPAADRASSRHTGERSDRQNSRSETFTRAGGCLDEQGEALSDARLAALYKQYGARLYRYAMLILADPAAAEDAVQEAFCRVLPVLTRNPDAISAPYVIRIVRNECYTLLRRRRRVPANGEPLLERASPDSSEEERLILSEALRSLPPEQREVIHLKVFEGLTFQEVADLCGVGINTAASRYRYAMAALRRALAPDGTG